MQHTGQRLVDMERSDTKLRVGAQGLELPLKIFVIEGQSLFKETTAMLASWYEI